MNLIIASDPIAVRNALKAALASPALHGFDDCARGTAQIVLAEVLNNIVEHAYAADGGEIHVSLQPTPAGVFVAVRDQGRALPNQELPQGNPPVGDPADGLPEGGFGWFLIRNLVQDLTYQRTGATNHLTFTLPGKGVSDNVH